MVLRILKILTSIALVSVFSAAGAAEEPTSPIVYPKENSVVGSKVNLVLDPTDIPFFQVMVGKTEYPVVDTSTGKHAYQGLDLLPGINTITVKVFTLPDENKKKEYKETASWQIKVFSMVGLYTKMVAPPEFKRQLFHSREHETSCSGCHNLEAQQDSPMRKPEDVICYVCHRKIPSGKHVHGPAAVWNCLACHNPDLYPVKYQFDLADPWKVSKATIPIEPMVFTFSSDEFFAPSSSAFVSKDKVKNRLQDVLKYIKDNPSEKIRLEVHTDNVPLKQKAQTANAALKLEVHTDNVLLKKAKGKAPAFKNNMALTEARAKVMGELLKEAGVSENKITPVGMGEKMPLASNAEKEGRELNNRIVIVVHPPDVKVTNSLKLPLLRDRERVVLNLTYTQGSPMKNLRIVEKFPEGMQYVKGSSVFNGKSYEPKIRGDKYIWEIGDTGTDFSGNLAYLVKKEKPSVSLAEDVKVTYAYYNREMNRDFDPSTPPVRVYTVKETCLKCHEGVLSGKFKHGPVTAGLCNLCHDPHASPNPAWLRKPTWELCTTCHADRATGVHVVSGFVSAGSHPTRDKRDPARRGKRMSCASCHDPHSADNRDLFAYNVKTRGALCNICHRK